MYLKVKYNRASLNDSFNIMKCKKSFGCQTPLWTLLTLVWASLPPNPPFICQSEAQNQRQTPEDKTEVKK